ncbi:hypothetical protein [Alkanindiges illinoisensis]|uniref:Uncharacterized protein n=1 Tax=Alkanindiges illinoisensis TaxID=197183 RepID=A0A4Y7XDJ4_9GAMM|nr:hypothetical protein [Alkanindiges illinoisensis]TEU29287.1 hypothetical protein E2B99_04285 [Alkanindiges illinoisensis]
MNIIFKTTFTTLTIAVATALLAGCGGSSNDSLPPSNQPVAQGKAVDFYLDGATVTFDNCPNSPSVKTDKVGSFTYPAACNNISTALTVTGGVDIGTGLPFEGVLKTPRAVPGALNIASPLTTLIAASGGNASDLAAKLGLSGTNLLTTDPMGNAALLKQTVVVQQFADQIQKTLLQLSASSNGTMTAAQAAAAAAAALSASITTSTGTVDLSSPALAESAVAGAVQKAAEANPSSLPFTGNELRQLATNTAAVAAATIADKVADVNKLTYVAIPNATADSIKATLGSQLAAIQETATSPAASNLIRPLADALTAPGVDVNALRALGNAVINNPNGIATALVAVNNSLPEENRIPATVVADLQQAELYRNYLQLDSISLNGGTAYNIGEIERSVSSGNELSVNGPLNNVQVKLNKVGSPFQDNFSEARIGLSYTIGTNQLDLIVNNVSLTFNNNGALTAAAVPLNASYSFRLSGALNVTGTTVANKAADPLAVSNGAVSLPIDTFLNKVASASGATAAQIANYRPTSGKVVSLKVALGKTLNTTVRVGTGTGEAAKAARSISINVDNSISNPIVLNGQGVDAVINVK